MIVSEAKIGTKMKKNAVPSAIFLQIMHLAKIIIKKRIRNGKINFGATGENYKLL